MMQNNYAYPIALLAIIGGAFYFLMGDLYNAGSINYAEYNKVCNQYLTAEPGEVSQDAMKSLIYKIDYLLPSAVNDISDPQEKSVKSCAVKLNTHLANMVVVEE